MKKNIFRKVLPLPFFLLLVIFLCNSCKRDIRTPANPEMEISIQQARDFFFQKTNFLLETGTVVSTSSSSSNVKAKKNLVKNLGNYLRWNSNKKISTNQGSLLLVDIDDSRFFIKENIFVTRKLVFSKTNRSDLEMNVVEIISFKKKNETEILEKVKEAYLDYINGIPQKYDNDVTVLIYDANYVRSSIFVKGGNTPSISRATIDLRNKTLQNTFSNSNYETINSVDCVLWGVFHIVKDGYGNVISETLLYTYYVGECGGVITTEENGEDAPVGGDLESNLDQIYQQMMDDFAESVEENSSYSTAPSSADGVDPIMGIQSWTVGKHILGQWSIVADAKYGYYHTEYFDVSQMRMIQNYNVFLYKTDKISFSGWNSLITSVWSTTSLMDQVLNNNTENTKGRTIVAGTISHTMYMKINVGALQIDKLYSSITHVNSKPFELVFK